MSDGIVIALIATVVSPTIISWLNGRREAKKEAAHDAARAA
jgi:hypothetical protein